MNDQKLPEPRLTGPVFSVDLSDAVDALAQAEPFDAQGVADAMAARFQLRALAEHLDRFLTGIDDVL